MEHIKHAAMPVYAKIKSLMGISTVLTISAHCFIKEIATIKGPICVIELTNPESICHNISGI